MMHSLLKIVAVQESFHAQPFNLVSIKVTYIQQAADKESNTTVECHIGSDIPILTEESMLLVGNSGYSIKNSINYSPFYMRWLLAFNMEATSSVCGFSKCLCQLSFTLYGN
jgi:hypothetical protein